MRILGFYVKNLIVSMRSLRKDEHEVLGNLMRKIINGLIIILFIRFGWFLYSSLQPNTWIGESEEGKWTAIYEQNALKDKWSGILQWNGNDEPIITYMEFKVNGVHSAGDDEPGSEKQTRSEKVEKDIEFASHGVQPNNSNTLELMLHWTEGNKEFEEVIVLQP